MKGLNGKITSVCSAQMVNKLWTQERSQSQKQWIANMLLRQNRKVQVRPLILHLVILKAHIGIEDMLEIFCLMYYLMNAQLQSVCSLIVNLKQVHGQEVKFIWMNQIKLKCKKLKIMESLDWDFALHVQIKKWQDKQKSRFHKWAQLHQKD